MKLYVSRADLEKGIPGDPGSCPIALAAKRAFPEEAPFVTVGSTALWVGEKRYAMGEEARRFVRVFDSVSQEPPRPGTLSFRESRLPPIDLRIKRWVK